MQLGIFAKTFAGGDPATVLAAVSAAGYDAVQYNMACSGIGSLPEVIAPGIADAVREASEASGVAIAAVSATYNMIHPVIERREAGRRSFEAIAGAAHAMGTRLLTVCTGSLDPDDQWRAHPDNQGAAAWQELIAEFALILPIAERCDIEIGVEPELSNVINSAHRARELIDTLRSDRIKIVLDPANLVEHADAVERKAITEEAVELLHDRIALAHAKDRTEEGEFVAAGLGAIDFGHFFRVLHAIGFDGPVITHGLAANEAASAAKFLRDMLLAQGIA
jgi:sugar phosphate isomerase/epimerase